MAIAQFSERLGLTLEPLEAGALMDDCSQPPGDAPIRLDCSIMTGAASPLIERPVTWVALAGFMGTGKSRIGWELSRALALHFVDTDKLIARVAGRPVHDLFAHEGEARFRAFEREVVRRVVRLDYAVVSLGGGAFVSPENRAALLSRGPVVVLWASPETILKRTQHTDRPLLQTEQPLERIRGLMAEREGAYREGTIHVSSDGRASSEVVDEIIEKLWFWQESDPEAEHYPLAQQSRGEHEAD